jgi:hypothetical protein
MKLEKLSAMAELVSSVAIVVTLIYLAVQTQQTNIAQHAASREATMMADVTMLAAVIENPEVNVNLEKAEVSKVEHEQLELFLAAFLRIREFAWFQYQNQILDEVTWQSYLAPARRVLRTPQGAQLWALHSAEMDPDFVADVNQFLASREGSR